MTDHRAWPTGEHPHSDPLDQPEAVGGGRHAAHPDEQEWSARAADVIAEEALDLETPGRHREAPAADDEPPLSVADAVREQLGGLRGMVESSLPVLVFVIVNIATSLKPALWAAIGSALLVAAYRLVRRDSIRHAVNGLLAVGIAAFIASRTGRAADFYIVNILRNSAGMLVFLVSAAIRRPLVGYAWRFIAEIPADWRERAPLVRTFTLLSLVWAAMFAIRAAVQIPLWIQNNADALGVVSIALGWPLFGAALAATVYFGRRALASEAPADV